MKFPIQDLLIDDLLGLWHGRLFHPVFNTNEKPIFYLTIDRNRYFLVKEGIPKMEYSGKITLIHLEENEIVLDLTNFGIIAIEQIHIDDSIVTTIDKSNYIFNKVKSQ